MKEIMNTKNILTIRMAFSKAVIIVFVTAISIVFVTGAFNVTQAQEEEQGQQQTSSSSAPPALPLPTSPSTSNTISPEEKLQMCDPNNPKLKFVNTTESNVCGLPKSIKAPEVLPPPATTTTSLPRSISSLSQRPIIPP